MDTRDSEMLKWPPENARALRARVKDLEMVSLGCDTTERCHCSATDNSILCVLGPKPSCIFYILLYSFHCLRLSHSSGFSLSMH